jgi:hypothetical protein
MIVGDKDEDTVKLIPKTFKPVNPDLTLFTIIHQSLLFRKADQPTSGIKRIIVLQRKIMSELLIPHISQHSC